jgi:hypothetical protein
LRHASGLSAPKKRTRKNGGKTMNAEQPGTPRLSALQAASNRAERRQPRKAEAEHPTRDMPIAFSYLRVSTKGAGPRWWRR